LLAYILEDYRKLAEEQNNSRERKDKEKKFAQVVCTLCLALAVTGTSILFVASGFAIYYCVEGELRGDIPCIPLLSFLGSFAVFAWRKRKLHGIKWPSARFTICASVSSYLVWWLLIGIMINPTWGVTVTLLLGFFLATFAFACYQYLIASENKGQVAFSCVCFVVVVFFLIVVVVVAGQAYYGRETADETLKAVLLSVIGALLSWLTWKKNLLELIAGDSSSALNKRVDQYTQTDSNGTELTPLAFHS